MDPEVCWAKFIDAMRDNDYDHASCVLDDLITWVRNGGYYPNGLGLVGLETLRRVLMEILFPEL